MTATYAPGDKLTAATLTALCPTAFPVGATPVDGTVRRVADYGDRLVLVVDVPGAGMAGDVTSFNLYR